MRKIELVTASGLEERLKECLEQRHMPDCFLYLGDSGVKNWLDLSDSSEFPISARLTELLVQGLPAISRRVPSPLDVVSIGVGSGEKERLLLGALLERGIRCRYLAVDISSHMVDQALDAAADIEVDQTGIVAFLEDLPALKGLWNTPVLLCLLGNNFCNYEADYLLDTVRRELGPDDLFLFDCHLLPTTGGDGVPGREQVEQAYRSLPNARFNTDPLVRRGLAPDGCQFHLELTPTDSAMGTLYRTHKWISILRDAEIRCGQGTVSLAAGDVVRLGFTCKYTRRQIEGYLERHGFETLEQVTSPDGDNLLALVGTRPR